MKALTDRYRAGLDESAVGTPVNSLRRHAVTLCIVLMIVSFLIWAGVSEIDQHVRATGRVVPAGNARTVQHLEGGIVMEILVAEGDKVNAGDPLFQIANTRVRTTLLEGMLQQNALLIRRERLLAEASGESTIQYSPELAQAQPDFVAAEQELFLLRRQEHLERLKGLHIRTEQKRLEVDALHSRIANMGGEVNVLERQAQIKNELYQSGVVSEASYLQIKGDLVRVQADRKNSEMQIPIVTAEWDEALSEIAEAERQYASTAKSELNEVEVNISSLKERLAALKDEVQRSEIISPIDGRVNELFLNTVGGVAQPGAPLAEITPARERLVVEGNMSTADRGKVWPDLKTMTQISAYDQAIYGGLEGTLSYISPDTFTNSDSHEYYKIRVALDSDRFDDEHVVRAGMTAEINILTGRISILDALLKPLSRLRSTALREGLDSVAKSPIEDAQSTASSESIFARVVGWLHLKDEHPLLPLSVLHYVPVSVLLNFLGVIVLVTLGFGTLREAFLTNVPLNGLIITIMMIGVGMSIVANLKLWRTGLYLFELSETAMQFRIRDEEIEKLQRQLKNKGEILDCKNMQNLLDNLRNMGALNVNDNDARMIKSKLGARINRGRGKVTFLGGLLVMLGLLGTFLGLLGTIDAVGEAMAGMANIGSDSGEGGGMSGFIASLSAPLQGMGLAFSSSLFGLSGSLLVGTFQYFSNGAQDHFIESVSRWLDEQIPGMGQANKAAGRPASSPPVADAELKAWIVGFIQTSQNTQRELADVVDAILVSADASRQSMETTQNVLAQQASLANTLSTLNQGVVSMREQQARVESVLTADFAREMIDNQTAVGSRLSALDQQFENLAGVQTKVGEGLNVLSDTLNDQIPRHVLQTSDRLGKALERINDKMGRQSIQDLAHVNELADQIKRLEKLVVVSERRSSQRDERAQTDLQNQFRRESDLLKKTIGENISTAVHKDVIPFIAREQRQLQKLARLIDKQYGRRKDDRQDPDEGVA